MHRTRSDDTTEGHIPLPVSEDPALTGPGLIDEGQSRVGRLQNQSAATLCGRAANLVLVEVAKRREELGK